MQKIQNGDAINNYTIKRLLGKGQYGHVYLAEHTNNKKLYAIKVIELSRFQENDGLLGQLIQGEIEALKRVKSDHVVAFADTFEDFNFHYLVMEYCDSGDLEAQLKDEKFVINEQDALGIIKQVLSGLKDLHAKFIIHRDLKLPNILVHNKSIYKIADLGFCRQLDDENQKSMLQLGTLPTMAPEIANGQQYGLSADMYSVGVILYYILYRRYPFTQKGLGFDVKRQLQFHQNKIRVSDSTEQLLKRMLDFNPNTRITFAEISVHEAFQKPTFSIISRIQIQSGQIDLSGNEGFYQDQTFNQQIQQEGERLKTRIQTRVASRVAQQLQQNQQQWPNLQPQNRPQQFQPLKEIKPVIDFSDKIKGIDQDENFKILNQKKSQIDLEIKQINGKINQIYYFSNTLHEITSLQIKAHMIFALICQKIQFMAEKILVEIEQKIDKNKLDKDLEDDVRDFQTQFIKTLELQDVVGFQLEDIATQLKQSGDNRFDQIKKQNVTDGLKFGIIFCLAIQEYLCQNQVITHNVYHIIQCGKYCINKSSDIDRLQQDLQFDLKISRLEIQNQEQVRKDFQESLNQTKGI